LNNLEKQQIAILNSSCALSISFIYQLASSPSYLNSEISKTSALRHTQSSCPLTLQHILKVLYFNSYQLSLLSAVYNFYPPCSISVVCTFDSTSTQSSKCQQLCSDCLPNCGHMFPIPNSSYQISTIAMKY